MNRKNIYMLIIAFVIILIDQIIKYLVINTNISIIPNILSLSYIENTGVAYGIGQGNLPIIIAVNIFLILFVVWYGIKTNWKDTKSIGYTISLSVIIGGGIGNLLDRVFKGYVIDYIKIELFSYPIFNMADICIDVGVILFVIIIIKEYILQRNKTKITQKCN